MEDGTRDSKFRGGRFHRDQWTFPGHTSIASSALWKSESTNWWGWLLNERGHVGFWSGSLTRSDPSSSGDNFIPIFSAYGSHLAEELDNFEESKPLVRFGFAGTVVYVRMGEDANVARLVDCASDSGGTWLLARKPECKQGGAGLRQGEVPREETSGVICFFSVHAMPTTKCGAGGGQTPMQTMRAAFLAGNEWCKRSESRITLNN